VSVCVCVLDNIGFVDGMNVYITHFVSVSLGSRQGTVRKLRCCSNITRDVSDVNYLEFDMISFRTRGNHFVLNLK